MKHPIAAIAACMISIASGPSSVLARRGETLTPGSGQVDLSLADWAALRERLEGHPPPPPPVPVSIFSRTLEGQFRKGLLAAELVVRFELHADGHQRVPLCDASASVERALLDGKPATLTLERGTVAVGVERRGRHEARLRILVGQEQDRFARRIRTVLPEGGATSFSILVPEREIEARLQEGVLTAESRRGEATLLEGQLAAGGVLDLRWARRVRHKSQGPARIEARVTSLLTVDEGVIRGTSVVDLAIREGEIDRVDLQLPRAVEPIKVTGDAVLQWQATSKRGQLSVLLRYLAQGQTRIVVHYLLPASGESVAAPLLLPAAVATLSGSVGVVAPASLEVKVRSRSGRRLEPRDLPPELSALSRTPILAGFSFAEEPGLSISVARRKQVALTGTLCDELHAATVVVEAGDEVSKLRLHLRNNTRQYLAVRLPEGARLTHAQLDGQPIRPARSGDRLLFPLRQSERIGEGSRQHTVEPGQTLGDIAHFYYSDPDRWRLILEANRHLLRDERSLRAGQRIRIPQAGKLTIEESSFVLELAYRGSGERLGVSGRRSLTLPELDVDTMEVHWHLYLPGEITPLRFDANLTQQNLLRYDPLRRARDFLRRALGVRDAWAGEYRSILSRRKTIFRSDAALRGSREASPATFPLSGDRYRFGRILAARDRPTISFLYARREAILIAQGGAFLVAAGLLVLLLLRPGRWSLICAGAAGLPMLLLAHHLPGVHHRLLAGALAGVAACFLARGRARRLARASSAEAGAPSTGLRELCWSPWSVGRWLRLRSLGVLLVLNASALFALRFPLLLSSTLLALLLFLWMRGGGRDTDPIAPPPRSLRRRRASAIQQAGSAKEVSHADPI